MSKLIFEVENNRFEKIKELIEKGEDLDYINEKGETPLIIASRNGNNKIVTLLFDSGADINRTKSGYTALYSSCSHDNNETSKLLIERGADVNIRNKHGSTPLSMAAYNYNFDIVKLLLEKGADVNNKCSFGYTPLMWAVSRRFGDTKVAALLLDSGAYVNAQNDCGETPMIIACSEGNSGAVELLIARNADIEVKDIWGNRAIETAYRHGYNETANILLRYYPNGY